MGKHKFSLIELIPNAWLYKLKDMNKTSTPSSSLSSSSPKSKPKSNSFTLPPPPPPQTKLLPGRPSLHKRKPPLNPPPALPDSKISQQYDHVDAAKVSPPPELRVPRILTKPAAAKSLSPSPPAAAGLHRLRLRAQSPRLAGHYRRSCTSPGKTTGAAVRRRKQQKGGAVSESLAVVKRSSDPQRDFRQSMMEMIAEKEMRTSDDELEDLLARYLSLNSKEHHEVIVEVFQQIWFDLKKLEEP